MVMTRTVGSYVMRPLEGEEPWLTWENFIVTANPDGSRTAQTMSRFPGCSVVRHVTQTVDAGFSPLDGHVRLFVDNVFKGILIRRVVGGTVTSLLLPPDGGPIDEASFTVDGPDMVLGYHPTAVEGWKLMKIDPAVEGPQTMRLLSPSVTWNGGTLGHGRKVEMPVEYIGDEEITVVAGTFRCVHYLWHTGEVDGDLDIWLTGPDRILARMNGYKKGFVYELDRYDVTAFGDEREFAY